MFKTHIRPPLANLIRPGLASARSARSSEPDGKAIESIPDGRNVQTQPDGKMIEEGRRPDDSRLIKGVTNPPGACAQATTTHAHRCRGGARAASAPTFAWLQWASYASTLNVGSPMPIVAQLRSRWGHQTQPAMLTWRSGARGSPPARTACTAGRQSRGPSWAATTLRRGRRSPASASSARRRRGMSPGRGDVVETVVSGVLGAGG